MLTPEQTMRYEPTPMSAPGRKSGVVLAARRGRVREAEVVGFVRCGQVAAGHPARAVVWADLGRFADESAG